jgi:deazaflavin-dependent oxidoreductase (nitroreductase family)
MPMPLWWGHINKHLFNTRALTNGKWKVITHVGRSSGNVYRTPLEAWDTGDIMTFVLVYGSGSDWVQNILASGTASLQSGDEVIELDAPRIVGEDVARTQIIDGSKLPPGFLKVDEFLQMNIVSRRTAEVEAGHP